MRLTRFACVLVCWSLAGSSLFGNPGAGISPPLRRPGSLWAVCGTSCIRAGLWDQLRVRWCLHTGRGRRGGATPTGGECCAVGAGLAAGAFVQKSAGRLPVQTRGETGLPAQRGLQAGSGQNSRVGIAQPVVRSQSCAASRAQPAHACKGPLSVWNPVQPVSGVHCYLQLCLPAPRRWRVRCVQGRLQ